MTEWFAVSALCIHAMGWQPSKPPERAFRTCMEVGVGAVESDLPPHIAVALSYTESRFNPEAESSVGALGPLQVLPRYHCPDRSADGCDLVAAGLSALRRYRTKYKNWAKALCHWNSGNECYRRSRLFSRIVLKRARLLARAQGD